MTDFPQSGDPKFDRLPKWAQNRIEQLEANVEYWQKKANEGPEDSDTFIQQYLPENKPLGNSPIVLFKFDNLDYRDQIEVQNCGDLIRVRGEDILSIKPVASNVVEITTKGRS